MKHVLAITAFLVATGSAVIADEVAQENMSKDAKLQQMLAEKQCTTGKPVLKEVVKTVPKMVAGRMIPTAQKDTIVVCQ